MLCEKQLLRANSVFLCIQAHSTFTLLGQTDQDGTEAFPENVSMTTVEVTLVSLKSAFSSKGLNCVLSRQTAEQMQTWKIQV